MAFDTKIAERVRRLVMRRKGFSEKKMFGGVGFMLNGNICCGVWKRFLILRIGPGAYNDALAMPFVKEFDITGRAMKGWVMVDQRGIQDDDDLRDWVQQALRFTMSLPSK